MSARFVTHAGRRMLWSDDLVESHGLDQQLEKKEGESLYFMDRIWVPLIGDVRTIIMDEAHKTKYSVHPGELWSWIDVVCLRDRYWWPGMKRDIATYVSKCLTCSKLSWCYKNAAPLKPCTAKEVLEPVEIMDREVKSLKRSKIALVKVRWNSKRGPEFTWEHGNYMKPKYPQLFVDRADSLAS
ncbi:putative reverse transcriptase domain-containing protein [Tanacetum coccineum]